MSDDPAAPIERDPIVEETVDITVPKWWADRFEPDLRTNLARWVTDTRRPSVPQPPTVWVSSDMTDAQLVAAVQTESHRWPDGPAVTRWAEQSTEETP